MAKKVDPLKAKQKKQKMIAIGGSVLLLALIAFQVPRVMKMMNKKPPVSAVSTTPTAAPPPGTPALAAPTLSGNEQTATPTATPTAGSLASGDAAPPVQEGQLASFSRFASKDPFAQQISTDTTGSSSSSSSGGTSGGSTPGSPSVPTLSGSPSLPTSSGSSAPAPGSAVISVNGTLMSVTVGTDFPQPSSTDPGAQPLFHLLSLTAHSARISIVGGSYSDGASAIALRENKAVTLMNTADGTRFKIVLKPQGTPVPSSSTSAPSTAPATSTTPSP